jgi:hypothetical protein
LDTVGDDREIRITPDLVVHADWGSDPKKRWMTRAVRQDGRYLASPPELAGAEPARGAFTRRVDSRSNIYAVAGPAAAPQPPNP